MLRRSLRQALLVAVAGILLLPSATAAATPYQAIVLDQACTSTGGAHGLGYVMLKVKAREVGMSGTNYFAIKSKLQWSSGLGFSTRTTYPIEVSSNFADDATNHYRIIKRRYDFKPSDPEIVYRFVITVNFRSNSDGLLASRTVRGGC